MTRPSTTIFILISSASFAGLLYLYKSWQDAKHELEMWRDVLTDADLRRVDFLIAKLKLDQNGQIQDIIQSFKSAEAKLNIEENYFHFFKFNRESASLPKEIMIKEIFQHYGALSAGSEEVEKLIAKPS